MTRRPALPFAGTGRILELPSDGATEVADGVFYEAGFGPRVAGEDGEVTAATE